MTIDAIREWFPQMEGVTKSSRLAIANAMLGSLAFATGATFVALKEREACVLTLTLGTMAEIVTFARLNLEGEARRRAVFLVACATYELLFILGNVADEHVRSRSGQLSLLLPPLIVGGASFLDGWIESLEVMVRHWKDPDTEVMKEPSPFRLWDPKRLWAALPLVASLLFVGLAPLWLVRVRRLLETVGYTTLTASLSYGLGALFRDETEARLYRERDQVYSQGSKRRIIANEAMYHLTPSVAALVIALVTALNLPAPWMALAGVPLGLRLVRRQEDASHREALKKTLRVVQSFFALAFVAWAIAETANHPTRIPEGVSLLVGAVAAGAGAPVINSEGLGTLAALFADASSFDTTSSPSLFFRLTTPFLVGATVGVDIRRMGRETEGLSFFALLAILVNLIALARRE